MTRKKYPFEHAKAMYSKWFWQLQNPNLFLGIKTKQSILLQIYLDIYLRYFNAAALFFSWWLMFHCCCIVPLLMIAAASFFSWIFMFLFCCIVLLFSWWLMFNCSCIFFLMVDISLQLHCSSLDYLCFIAAALFFSSWLMFHCCCIVLLLMIDISLFFTWRLFFCFCFLNDCEANHLFNLLKHTNIS